MVSKMIADYQNTKQVFDIVFNENKSHNRHFGFFWTKNCQQKLSERKVWEKKDGFIFSVSGLVVTITSEDSRMKNSDSTARTLELLEKSRVQLVG